MAENTSGALAAPQTKTKVAEPTVSKAKAKPTTQAKAKPKAKAQQTFKIEQGVPIPSAAHGRKGHSKYPFGELKVGDSFAVDKTRGLAGAKRQYEKDHPGTKFVTRATEDGGRRVWRIL